jgi:hypothetical protein
MFVDAGPRGAGAVLVALLAGGCGEEEEPEPRTDPDITAEYDVTIANATGCDGSVTLTWAEGPLQVSGLPDLLGFDFGDGVFAGSVDLQGNVAFGGVKAQSETSLTEQVVTATGVASEGGGGWRIEGDLSAVSSDLAGLECTMAASFTAVEEP